MNTRTKCDICGLNITLSSKLLEASQYDEIISTMKLLKDTEQLPVQFNDYRNKELGDTISFCVINDTSYGLTNKCEHWQLNTGKSTNEYVSIHLSKSNYFLSRIVLGVSVISLIIAIMGHCKPTKDTPAANNKPLSIKKEDPENIPDKATNPVSRDSIKVEKINKENPFIKVRPTEKPVPTH